MGGARRRYNAQWADFRSRGGVAGRVPQDFRSHADLEAVRLAMAECPLQPPITLFLHGPEIAGETAPLPPVTDSRSPSDILNHRALLVLGTLLDAVGRTRAYGGFWSSPTSDSAALVLWVDYPDARLCVVPRLQLGLQDIAVSYSHGVLWRQPWMTEHSTDDFGWADLSTNYQSHIGDGGTYWEAMASWNKGERLWSKSFFGVGFDRSHGSAVLMSQRFHSFYHFQVGEDPFRPGSSAGQDLQRIRVALASLAQSWAEAAGAPGRSARPPGARPDKIRQRED